MTAAADLADPRTQHSGLGISWGPKVPDKAGKGPAEGQPWLNGVEMGRGSRVVSGAGTKAQYPGAAQRPA